MKNIKIPITEEELKSIQDYSGYKHAKINMIGNMKPQKVDILMKKGWILDKLPEELERSIQDFINIYSAIYKAGDIDGTWSLCRGTSNDEISNIRKNSNINSIYSASYSEEIAKQFTEYGNAAIVRTHLQEGLPYLYIESLKEEEKRNEEEVLILPFAKVKNIELISGGKHKEYSYYDLQLEKEELPELDKQDIKILKDRCLNDFEQHIENLKIYNSLHRELEYLHTKDTRYLDAESTNAILKKMRECWDKSSEYRKKIDNYINDFSTMLKAECRQKEIEIDKQREEIMKRQEEEKAKREQERQENLKKLIEEDIQTIESKLLNIGSNVEENIMQITINANKYANLAERLGINYTQKPGENLQEIVSRIQQKLEDKRKEITSKEYQKDRDKELQDLYLKQQQINKWESKILILPNLVSTHNNQSMQEIKYNLNTQVRDMIYKTKMARLENEKNHILSKKDNIFQRLTGKNKIKQEELKKVENKIKLALRNTENMNPENKVSKMLEEMYVCVYEDLNCVFSQEMLDMITKIRENFGNLPKEEILHERAKERVNGQQLSVVKDKNSIFKKRRLVELREKNKMLEEEIRGIEETPKIKSRVQIDSMANINNSLENIYETIDRDELILFFNEKER